MYHYSLFVLINTIESLLANLFITKINQTGAEFLDEIQTKALRVFLLAIHSHLYSIALRFLFLQTHATSYVILQFNYFTLWRRKEENLIENHTPLPMFKKTIQKPQVWEISILCKETSSKLYFHEFGFWRMWRAILCLGCKLGLLTRGGCWSKW